MSDTRTPRRKVSASSPTVAGVAATSPILLAAAAATLLPGHQASADRVTAVRAALSAPPVVLELSDEQQRQLKGHNPYGAPITTLPGNRTLVVREGYSLSHN